MFWDMATRALHGLGPNIRVGQFSRAHIEAVAPYILGITVWTVIKARDFTTWEGFKRAVEEEFGMNQGIIEANFFRSKPKDNESSSEFIVRMERERGVHGFQTGRCLSEFKQYLSELDMTALDGGIQWEAITGKAVNQVNFTWEHVVNLARYKVANKVHEPPATLTSLPYPPRKTQAASYPEIVPSHRIFMANEVETKPPPAKYPPPPNPQNFKLCTLC